jgi:nucleotide-binding universal stress UspA family protein
MYRRILVAIDGSATGDRALTEAVRLAEIHGATLRIAHVIDATAAAVDRPVASAVRRDTERTKAAREMLTEASTFAKRAGLRVEIHLLEIEGLDQRVVDVIAEEARAWPADVIVIGAHGIRGSNRRLLGSVADEIVRTASEPERLVREAHCE